MEIKFISFAVLQNTVVLDDVIYAPSDDGATRLPKRLAEYLGKKEADGEEPKLLADGNTKQSN